MAEMVCLGYPSYNIFHQKRCRDILRYDLLWRLFGGNSYIHVTSDQKNKYLILFIRYSISPHYHFLAIHSDYFLSQK